MQGSLLFANDTRWQVPTELPDLRSIPRIAVDTETDGKNPFVQNSVIGISLAWRDSDNTLQRFYAPIRHADGNMDASLVKRWLSYILRDKSLVFCNAKYDIAMLRNTEVDIEALGAQPSDVAFSAALIDDSRHVKLNLNVLGQQYVGEGKRTEPYDMSKMAETPSWLVAEYAMQDAALTLQIAENTQPLIERDGLAKVLQLENSLIYAVCEIERNGCRIDVEKLEQWRKEIRAEYERIVMSLYSATGIRVQPGSGESIIKLCAISGIKPPPTSIECKSCEHVYIYYETCPKCGAANKAANRAYSEDELLALKHPLMNTVVDARRNDSLLSKFLDKYHDGLDGDILRSQFHQLKGDEYGAISGRFSSSGGGDLKSGYAFNAQQCIKPKLQQRTTGDHHIVRELFIPNDGQELWACDADQIEFRLLVHFSDAKKLLAAYEKDVTTNYHRVVHELIKKRVSIDYDEAKNTNFARLYGGGAKKIASMTGMSVQQTTDYLNECDRILPEAKDFMKSSGDVAEKRGWVETILGRRARFGKHDSFYKATNRVIQGSAADVFKLKLLRVYNERRTLGITTLRQPVHDEQVGDKDPDPKYTERIREFFNEQEIDCKVPLLWKLETGKNWKECK